VELVRYIRFLALDDFPGLSLPHLFVTTVEATRKYTSQLGLIVAPVVLKPDISRGMGSVTFVSQKPLLKTNSPTYVHNL